MKTLFRLICVSAIIMVYIAFNNNAYASSDDYKNYTYDEIMADAVSASAISVTIEDGIKMQRGESLRLHYDLKPSKVVWKVSDSSVATVSNNRVKALKKGKVKVSCIYKDEAYEWNIEIEPKKKKVIYLTFDDGPSLSSTPKVLNILKKNKVKATFFVINFDKKGAKLIERAEREGHTIAIHGYSHDYSKIYKSEKAYMKNLTTLQDKLYDLLGYNVWITRFPGGGSNLVSRRYSKGIMTRLAKKTDKAGFAYFDWNVGSGDASPFAITSDQIYRNVTRSIKKNQENIVLMHDFSGNYKTINALDRIIKYGKKKGYIFRAITDSTTPVHHGINN